MFKDNLDIKEYHQMEDINAGFMIEGETNCFESAVESRNNPGEQNDAQARGILVHNSCEVDTEDDVLNHYGVIPPDIKVKRGNKWEEFKAWCDEENKIPIKEKEFDMAIECRRSAYKNELAAEFLKNSRKEISGFCNLLGVDVRARPDLECAKINTLVDIKTRQKGQAKKERWMRDWLKYKTYIQAGLQIKVWQELEVDIDHYWYLLIEVEKPYIVHTVYLSPKLITLSIEQTLEAIKKWKAWLNDGSPSGYGEPEEMELDPWQEKRLRGEIPW